MKNNIFVICWILLLTGLVFAPVNAQSAKDKQPYIVTGVVSDASTGKPLPGIHVDVKGISSSITDDNGGYKIGIPKTNVILTITGYGYASRDISVRGRDKIDIVLYPENYKGAQTVVYTPLGDVSSTEIANSLSVIKEDNSLSVAVTPSLLLKGYASGLNTLSRSGTPGAGSNIYLHGFNTMNAGSMPLFIIDGLPYENSAYSSSLIGNYVSSPLSSIEVKDIESITVMKDGMSLYGVKGANGVVLIRTLRANKLETKINVHVRTGINFMPEQLSVLNSSQHRNLISDLMQTSGLSSAEIEQLPYFNNEIPTSQAWGYEGNTDYYRYNNATNWQPMIYDSKLSQDYYLNVAGGDEIAKYVLSLGYLDQKGTLKNTYLQRFNTRFNSEVKLSQNVYFLSNMSFIYGNKKLMNEGTDGNLNPILASLIKSPFTATHIYNEEGSVSPNEEPTDVFGNSNPYVLANNLLLATINYRFMGTFELGWNIANNFNVSGLIGLNFNKERERVFYPSVGVAFDQIGETLITNEMQHRTDRLFSLYADAHAGYQKAFSSDHKLNVRAGVRYQNNSTEDDYGKSYNSSSDDFRTIGYGVSLLRQIGGSLGRWNWMSIYGIADYALQNKYFFCVSLSSDASSRYGREANTFYTYPSVAGAWLISGEEFMKDFNAVDMMKIRVSYGLSGNDDIGNYNGMQYYTPQNLLGNYGLVRGNLVNLGLKPETVQRINAGLDMSFFKERLNVSVDVYSNTTRDMILVSAPERISGFNYYISNAGTMRNNGIDLNIQSRVLNGTFKWDLAVMLSTYRNEVLNLNGEEFNTEVAGATVQTKVGQALGLFYGYKTKGVYATQADADADGLSVMQGLVETPFSAGDVRFANQNSDKLIDENDMVVIGDPNPDIFGSISNIFQYKRWTLNSLLVYSLGNDVYNYTRYRIENLSTYDNQSLATLNRWRHEGDITNIPRAVYGDPMGNSRFSDRWIEDGSYIRMKTLTLSYDLNIGLNMIQSCTLFATAENILTLTKYKGLDPEFSLGQNPLYLGIDPCVVAQPRTISLGINIAL